MENQTIKNLEDKVHTLTTWIQEMQSIIRNPYSAGLNVAKMLEDLKNFADALSTDMDALVSEMEIDKPETESSEKAK